MPPILNRLGLDENTWLDELNQFKFERKKAVETVQQLKDFVERIKQKIKADISLIPALEWPKNHNYTNVTVRVRPIALFQISRKYKHSNK